MRNLLLCVLISTLFAACSHISKEDEEVATAPKLAMGKWQYMVKAHGTFVEGVSAVPKSAYVFPPLRLNANSQPIDTLTPRQEAPGELSWISSAPKAMEVKSVIEKKLRSRGFKILTFQQMTENEVGHSVMVFNPYYIEARQVDAKAGGGWSVFTRITASTFPVDLDPAKQRQIMNQEAVTLFVDESQGASVVKASLAYLLDYIGKKGEWSETLSLLR